MSFPTLETVKKKLGISAEDTMQDDTIMDALELSMEIIECELGCNPCKYEYVEEEVDGETTQVKKLIDHELCFRICCIDWSTCEIMLCLPHICDIVSINGIPYTGTKGETWRANKPRGRCLTIWDLPKYCKDVRFKELDIVVNGGYDPIPRKLCQLVYGVVAGALCEDFSGMPVSGYSFGDKSVDYCCTFNGKTISTLTNPVEYLESLTPPSSIMCC